MVAREEIVAKIIVANPCPAVIAVDDPLKGFELEVDAAQCPAAIIDKACIPLCIKNFPIESARSFGAKAIG